MKKLRFYVSHSIRGVKGSNATGQDMETNNQRAIDWANSARIAFPNIDFYVPGEHDEFVSIAHRKGYLSEYTILDVDKDLLRRRDGLIVFTHDGYIGGGVGEEIRCAQENNIPIFFVFVGPYLHTSLNTWITRTFIR